MMGIYYKFYGKKPDVQITEEEGAWNVVIREGQEDYRISTEAALEAPPEASSSHVQPQDIPEKAIWSAERKEGEEGAKNKNEKESISKEPYSEEELDTSFCGNRPDEGVRETKEEKEMKEKWFNQEEQEGLTPSLSSSASPSPDITPIGTPQLVVIQPPIVTPPIVILASPGQKKRPSPLLPSYSMYAPPNRRGERLLRPEFVRECRKKHKITN